MMTDGRMRKIEFRGWWAAPVIALLMLLFVDLWIALLIGTVAGLILDLGVFEITIANALGRLR